MNTKTRIALVAAAALVPAAQAQIGTVSMSFLETKAGRNAHIEIDNNGMNVFAGQLHHFVLDGEGAGIGLIGDQTTYCVDLFQHVATSPNAFTLVPLDQASDSEAMGSARAGAIRDVLSAAGDDAWFATSNNFGAAVQLVLWEIAYDYDAGAGLGSLDFGNGRFEASIGDSSTWASVQSYAGDLFDAIGSGGTGQFIAATSESRQDQVLRIVPAPGPLALAGLGLVMVPRRSRRG